jgi:hypothetical protein
MIFVAFCLPRPRINYSFLTFLKNSLSASRCASSRWIAGRFALIKASASSTVFPF